MAFCFLNNLTVKLVFRNIDDALRRISKVLSRLRDVLYRGHLPKVSNARSESQHGGRLC